MGEYARYNGERIKIGTCEDMYYLSPDQRRLITPEPGNVDAAAAWSNDTSSIRLRFAWPDEDGSSPGTQQPYDRAVSIPGVACPPDVGHDTIQFVAHAGYLVSLPCPESDEYQDHNGLCSGRVRVHPGKGIKVARNGFSGAVLLEQLRRYHGLTVAVCRCGGCGVKFHFPTLADAEPLIAACRAEADRQQHRASICPGATAADISHTGAWWQAVAVRIEAGYRP